MGYSTHTHNHNHDRPHSHSPNGQESASLDILYPLRRLIDGTQIKNSRLAHLICQLIPCCCPFERDIQLFRWTFHVPAFCKLNPLYDNFIGLRFRALSYLADICGEDVSKYIC
jgi:hypothetical protein